MCALNEKFEYFLWGNENDLKSGKLLSWVLINIINLSIWCLLRGRKYNYLIYFIFNGYDLLI